MPATTEGGGLLGRPIASGGWSLEAVKQEVHLHQGGAPAFAAKGIDIEVNGLTDLPLPLAIWAGVQRRLSGVTVTRHPPSANGSLGHCGVIPARFSSRSLPCFGHDLPLSTSRSFLNPAPPPTPPYCSKSYLHTRHTTDCQHPLEDSLRVK